VEKAGYIVAFFGIGAVIAKPLVGLVSDWLGGIRKVPSIVCLAAFVLMLLIFGRLETESAFLIAAPLLGVTAFVYSPLMAAMIAEVAGRSLAGSATGLTNAIWQLGSVIVPLAVGFVFQATQSFSAAFTTLAAGPLFGLLCMLVVREPEKF
jgi:sugar phosphate permease